MNSAIAPHLKLRLFGRGIQIGFKTAFSVTRIEQDVNTGEHLLFAFYTEEGLRNLSMTKLADGGWSMLHDKNTTELSRYVQIEEIDDEQPWRIIDDHFAISSCWPTGTLFSSTGSYAKWMSEFRFKKEDKDSFIFCRGPFHALTVPSLKRLVGADQKIVSLQQTSSGFWVELSYDYRKTEWLQVHIVKQLEIPDDRIFIVTTQCPKPSREQILEAVFHVADSLISSPRT